MDGARSIPAVVGLPGPGGDRTQRRRGGRGAAARARHPGRTAGVHQGHHPGHAQRPGPGDRLRLSARRLGGIGRHLHHPRGPRGRDGAGNQHRRGVIRCPSARQAAAARKKRARAQDVRDAEKAENFMAAFIESIAKQRDRNVEWAEKAVRESVAIPQDEALELERDRSRGDEPRGALRGRSKGASVEAGVGGGPHAAAPRARRWSRSP